MAGGLSGDVSETNGTSRLDLPHLTRRELLSHRAKLERAMARGQTTEPGTALLARIERAKCFNGRPVDTLKVSACGVWDGSDASETPMAGDDFDIDAAAAEFAQGVAQLFLAENDSNQGRGS